jgi:hypothetical protein
MRLIKEYEWCKEYDIDCLTIDICDDYITIWNSYKITKISHMLEVIETIRQYSRIYNRSNFQLVSEWRSHNLLYDLNYETVKTKDVNFNPDVLWHENCLYVISSFFYGIVHKIVKFAKNA